jgi:hypothetical protein
MAREILSKRNFFDFESPDSAISRFPMTLIIFYILKKNIDSYNFMCIYSANKYVLNTVREQKQLQVLFISGDFLNFTCSWLCLHYIIAIT